MESAYKSYNYLDSVSRIDEILDAPAGNFEERDSIPARSSLTYKNGFYVNCTCIYMDIKNSSQLPQKHKRPRLAKIYRSFISEAVAVLNGSALCAEVNIHGDAVWAVLEAKTKNNIDSAFSVCAQLASLIKILNCRLKKRGIETISVGIGADYGRALRIKAGYNGSGINDVVWMGDVVNGGANMCKSAKQQLWNEAYTCVSDVFYQNLNDHNKSYLHSNGWNVWGGNVGWASMDNWWDQNCKEQPNTNYGYGY